MESEGVKISGIYCKAISLIMAALMSLAATPVGAEEKATNPVLVIENVTVLTMAEGADVLENRTVTIEDGRVSAIAPSADSPMPENATRIDGSGKWLIPGLHDMHVHVGNDRLLRLLTGNDTPTDGTANTQDLFTPFIANGVTQVFDLASMPETIGQRIEIESGRVLGPHIATAAMIDGPEPILPFGISRTAASPEAGRQAVRDIAADNYRFVKIYGRVDLPTFNAILEEAGEQGLRVVGHIPQRGKGITEAFFQPGFELVVHAEEFAQRTRVPDHAAIPEYVEMARRNGTALVSTLTANERIAEIADKPESLKTRPEFAYLAPQARAVAVEFNPYAAQASEGFAAYTASIVAFNGPFIRAFSGAGLPILTGSDAGIPGVVAGFSLHDEFEALARAGLDNLAILEGSTRLAAEWLGTSEDRGTIGVGKRADLVMLNADPLEDIGNTRRIAAVIRDGRYLGRDELDAMMADLAVRNRD